MTIPRISGFAAQLVRGALALALAGLLAACSGPAKPKPTELPANVPLLGVRQAWTLKIPEVAFPLQAHVAGDVVTVAASDGTVVAIDARTGQENWRARLGKPLLAGVGSDGSVGAVVTTENELIAFQRDKVLWTQKLNAEVYTAPLVAGRRVFVQAADRTLSAYDGMTGRRLWTQTRTAEPLVLRKAGVLTAVGDTLVGSNGGRLVGSNPANGSSRWEFAIAAPRGTNDVERLVDLTGTVSRSGDVVCARAYYANIGCVDAARGSLLWTRPAVGSEGLSGDERLIFGTESDGKVVAWNRSDGERAWVSERLRYRVLSAPLLVGRSLVVGDGTGLVHLLSRDDGTPLNRVATDGSPITVAPVVSGNTVVVVTRNGGVYGFRPE
ncbi:MAG: outer membrane protein assembly factor BamB [Comamonadaceae bacterium]|nr:MAG: outer membrane protein assembly factor BamB [Comamonadaceae bacterium]